MDTKPGLVLFIAEYDYFLSHRLGLARAAVAEGYTVTVITRVPENVLPIEEPGIRVIPMALRRSLANPLADLRVVWRLTRILRRLRPQILHNVSIKLALLGSVAAWAARVPCVLNAYTGLGYAFHAEGTGPTIMRALATPMLALAGTRRGCWSLFQNDDDMQACLRRGLCRTERSAVISGAGVDTQVFAPVQEPVRGPVTVLFVGRLLWDKGIGDFVQAAHILREHHAGARFVAAGDPDPENPRSIDARTLKRWYEESGVRWAGRQTDMPALYRNAHVLCLPSYHEGLPKVLLEGAACGLPLVATDIPGCRAVVEDGVNGLLVPVADPERLAKALEKLILNKELRDKMGAESRRLAEQRFSADLINGQVLALYRRMAAAGDKGEIPSQAPL